jgi:hypothetical protein
LGSLDLNSLSPEDLEIVKVLLNNFADGQADQFIQNVAPPPEPLHQQAPEPLNKPASELEVG